MSIRSSIRRSLEGSGGGGDGRLPYLVGKDDGTNTYPFNTIEDAIDAAELVGVPAVITIMPGIYSELLEITSPDISLFGFTGESDSTEITGVLTFNVTGAGQAVVEGLRLSDIAVEGSSELDLTINNCQVEGGTAIDITNSSSATRVEVKSSFVIGSVKAIARTGGGGAGAIIVQNSEINGDIDLNAVGGILIVKGCTTKDTAIDISSSTALVSISECTLVNAGPSINAFNYTGTADILNCLIFNTASGAAITFPSLINTSFFTHGITTSTNTTFNTGVAPLLNDGIKFESAADGSAGLGTFPTPNTPTSTWHVGGTLSAASKKGAESLLISGGATIISRIGYQEASAATVVDDGTNYAASDVLTVAGGTLIGVAAQFTVVSVDGGGAITGISLLTAGEYSAVPDDPAGTTTGGSGSGATLDVTYIGSGTKFASVIEISAADLVDDRMFLVGDESGTIDGSNKLTVRGESPALINGSDTGIDVTNYGNFWVRVSNGNLIAAT